MSNKNYVPGTMSFMDGFTTGAMNSAEKKESDWMDADNREAHRKIKELLKDGRIIGRAELGLDGDWDENSTEVYDGKDFHDYDAWSGSLWATPTLMVYFDDGPSEAFPCYKKKKR